MCPPNIMLQSWGSVGTFKKISQQSSPIIGFVGKCKLRNFEINGFLCIALLAFG